MDPTDHDLLQRFARDHDQAAFQELVRRHVGLVHGVARRITASDELAKDASQDTFVRLARRATLIPANLTLSAWLHRTSRSFAIDLVRAETSRRKHEMKAATLPPPDPSSDDNWGRLAPLIDDLVAHLSGPDRDAILLRFYQNLSYPEIGRRLGVSEEAARQRSLRATDKLRALLRKRGIATTSAALSLTLSTHAATAPPASLVVSIIQATHSISPTLSAGLLPRLLTMTVTHKISLACAALILLATTAYTRPWSIPDRAGAISKSTASPPINPTQTSSSRATGGRPLPSNSQGRLERLRAILAIDDAVERRRQMIALIDQTATTQFEDACNSFLSLNRKDRAAEETLLTLAWTRADPQAALTYGDKHGLANNMARYWATFDPDAALAWVRANPESAGPDRDNANLRVSYVLAGIAQRDPAGALKLLVDSTRDSTRSERVSKLVPAQERSSELGRLYAVMAHDGEPLERLLSGTTDESLRGEIISTAAAAVSENDPVAAAQILIDHPAAANANLPSQNKSIEIFTRWAGEDPGAVIDALVAGPPEIRAAVLPAVTLGLTNTDLPAAYAMLARCPEADYLGWVDEMTGIVIRNAKDISTKVEQFAQIQNEALRDRAMVLGLQAWRKQDAPAAGAWVADHPLSAAVQAKISQP